MDKETKKSIISALFKTYSREDIFNGLQDADNRLSWNVNSSCLIYSRSNNKWFNAKITKIIIKQTNDIIINEQEWLIVKYNNTFKQIQRFCTDIMPINSQYRNNDNIKRVIGYIGKYLGLTNEPLIDDIMNINDEKINEFKQSENNINAPTHRESIQDRQEEPISDLNNALIHRGSIQNREEPISDLNNALIHGFCRDMESVLIVPDVIRMLILKFYEREYFETINQVYIKYMDKNVRQSISIAHLTPNTSYGAISIPTNIDNKCRYVWQFKISNCKSSDMVVIGIDEYHKWQALCCNFAGLNTRSNYGYCSDGHLKSNEASMSKVSKVSKRYPIGYGNNDTITMKLDLIDNTLSYTKNNVDLGMKFVNIERSDRLCYRLAVCIQGSATVTLIDSKIDT